LAVIIYTGAMSGKKKRKRGGQNLWTRRVGFSVKLSNRARGSPSGKRR